MRFLPPLPAMCLALTALLACTTAHAEDVVEQQLTIKDHAFQPHDMTVPAGKKIKITLTNQDATPAEFESYELHREKTVGGNSTITLFVGPLDPGTYPYFDDFHKDMTTGTIIAK